MGLFEDDCPTMAAAGTLVADVDAAVAFDPLDKPAADVNKPVTTGKIGTCLKYFKWKGATQYPVAKTKYVAWNFAEVAEDVNLLPRQVEALYNEFLTYKAATAQGGTP